MDEIDVPSYFLCPISLEIMKDPVTVYTGITYDRESIEKWLFSKNNNTCPVTKQPLSDCTDLTPNHTLRRLIQAWLYHERFSRHRKDSNSKATNQQIPNFKASQDASHSPLMQIKCLRRLKSIASGKANPEDEALSILHNLHLSETGLKTLLGFKNGDFINTLTRVMQKGGNSEGSDFLKGIKSDTTDPDSTLSLGEKQDQSSGSRAVRILLSISKFSATPNVLQEMLKLGVVAKLCLVLQVDSGSKAKEKAREILKLHGRTWRESPCIPNNLLSSYPACM
ncbi:Zinc finger, RING/FYVE/PHD-type [Sesbania bispinosa]|nr:Zinc finger, RING/FYVE/PHD-type [Sesbania bispinosa]